MPLEDRVLGLKRNLVGWGVLVAVAGNYQPSRMLITTRTTFKMSVYISRFQKLHKPPQQLSRVPRMTSTYSTSATIWRSRISLHPLAQTGEHSRLLIHWSRQDCWCLGLAPAYWAQDSKVVVRAHLSSRLKSVFSRLEAGKRMSQDRTYRREI